MCQHILALLGICLHCGHLEVHVPAGVAKAIAVDLMISVFRALCYVLCSVSKTIEVALGAKDRTQTGNLGFNGIASLGRRPSPLYSSKSNLEPKMFEIRNR